MSVDFHTVKVFNFINSTETLVFLSGKFVCVCCMLKLQSLWSTWPNPSSCQLCVMFSSIILNNFAFEICLWIFLSEFCVSYKVCVYIYFIPCGFQLIIHHLFLEKLRDIVFIWVWIPSLTDSAVLTAGATAPSDLWGKRGRHFPYWPQGGAKPSSLPHPQACSLQPWLSPSWGELCLLRQRRTSA